MEQINKNQVITTAQAYLTEEPKLAYRREITQLIKDVGRDDKNALFELSDRMRGPLRFGTAGVRARMGAGYGRINLVTVAKTAWAIGQHVKTAFKKIKRPVVVVAFDARLNSLAFAKEITEILKGQGLRVRLFKRPVATPICSFAVIKLKAQAAIMVTASHNPPQDNGLKVYWNQGAQIIAPHNDAIETLVLKAPSFRDTKKTSVGPTDFIGDDIASLYLAQIKKAAFHKNIAQHSALRIVYTPMHGVGWRFTKQAFQGAGFKDIHVVKEQQRPDGKFPTVLFPNPEEEGALDLAVQLAKRVHADVILANDPDADRLAVMIPEKNSDNYKQLSGNEIGCLLAEDVLKNLNKTEKKALVATSFVSSQMLKKMAEDFSVAYIETATGFPNIANMSLAREKSKKEIFVFGYEEALGFCIGDQVRDKDGISAAVRMAELIAFLKTRGRDIWDELDRLALSHGVFRNLQWSIRFDDALGQQKIAALMASFRAPSAKIKKLGNLPVSRCVDFLQTDPNLPRVNMLAFYADPGARLLIRPSGTEPKIKFYLEMTKQASSRMELKKIQRELDENLLGVRRQIENLQKGDS